MDKKEKKAKKVITPTQKYHFTQYGKTVEAESLKEATKKIKKEKK